MLMTPDLQTDRTQTTLIIPNLQSEEDEGEYRCKARNVWGEVNTTFPVKVYGKTRRSVSYLCRFRNFEQGLRNDATS